MFDKSELRLEENVFVKSVIGHLSMLAEVGEVVELSEKMHAQMAATVLSSHKHLPTGLSRISGRQPAKPLSRGNAFSLI